MAMFVISLFLLLLGSTPAQAGILDHQEAPFAGEDL
jgi:hypothetical protein